MTERVIFGMLDFGGANPLPFELRHGSWLCDDPGQIMRWHGGPFEVSNGATLLKAATDMGTAIRLNDFDPSTVVKQASGTGQLMELAKDGGEPIDLTWSVTSVIDLPSQSGG
jgi:hypothetical protein